MILGALKCWAHNFFRVIKLLVKIIWPPKNCGLKKSFWSEKDFWFKKFWSTEIKALKKLGPKSFVKVGSVTAEILLIWTNVARTYVSWTNVTKIAGFC